MCLDKLDHVAIEVPDLDAAIETFQRTGGLKVLRLGTATATGSRIAMLGDRAGMKIELIEGRDAGSWKFLHIAFATDHVESAVADAQRQGWMLARGPNDIAPAKARSAFMSDDAGFEFQVLAYGPDSPDTKTW